MSIQIIHCADLHLDKNFGISNYERAIARKDDLFRNFDDIVNYALENKPDLFIISGDVYDRVLPTNAARVILIQRIRRLKDAGIKIFLIGGNHDVPKTSVSSYLAIDVLESSGLATVFSRSDSLQKKTIMVKGQDVCISGKSYDARDESQNPLKNEKIPLEGKYNILMLHASFQGLGVTSSVPEFAALNPIHSNDVPSKLKYLALGHFHNSFDRRIADCYVCNPGSTEKLSWAEEQDSKGFFWAEICNSETRIEAIHLKTRKMETKELVLSRNSGDINEAIMTFLSDFKDINLLLRLRLKGMISQEQQQKFRVRNLFQACQQLFFHFMLDRRELLVEGYGRIFLGKIDNPEDAYVKRLDELIQKTQDENEKLLLIRVKEEGRRYLGETS